MPNELIAIFSDPEHLMRFRLLLVELKKLDTPVKRQRLLAQMKIAANEEHELLNDFELSSMLTALFSYQAEDSLQKYATLSTFNGIILDKVITKLARRMVIVRSPATAAFEVCILSNRNFFNKNLGQTLKYTSKDQRVSLGQGSFKSVKTYISLTLDTQNNLQVKIGARLRIDIIEIGYDFSDQQFSDFNRQLNNAATTAQVLEILRKIEFFVHNSLTMPYLAIIFGEVRISQMFSLEPDITSLQAGNPFIKKIHNKYYLRVYFFTTLASHNSLINLEVKDLVDIPTKIASKFFTLSAHDRLLIKNSLNRHEVPALFENLVDQIIAAVAKIHQRDVLHCDLKRPNILLDHLSDGKLQIKITDFGAAIDLQKVRNDTKKFLTQLGYLNVGNGEIEGYLLSFYGVTQLLDILTNSMVVENCQQSLPESENYQLVTPTLAGLNLHLHKIIPNFKLGVAEILTTLSHAAPDVYSAQKKLYTKEKYQRYLGVLVAEKLGSAIKILPCKADKKNDVWALGVLIFEFIFRYDPVLNQRDLAIIMHNPMLAAMLHPDIEQRCSLEQAIKIRSVFPIISLPKEQDFVILAQQYMKLIDNLRGKLSWQLKRHELLVNLNALSLKLRAYNMNPDGFNDNYSQLLAVERENIFGEIDIECEEGSLLSDQDFFVDIRFDKGLFYKYLSQEIQRQQMIFSNLSKKILSIYLEKYFSLFRSCFETSAMLCIASQVCNLFSFNLVVAELDKKNMLQALIFRLIEGRLDFSCEAQLLMMVELLKLVKGIDMVNSQGETLLHVIFSTRSQAYYALKMFTPSSVLYSQKNAALYSQVVLFLIQNNADVTLVNLDGESVFELMFVNYQRFFKGFAYDAAVRLVLDKSSQLTQEHFEKALYFALAKGESTIVVSLLTTRLLEFARWDNYALVVGRSIWDLCADDCMDYILRVSLLGTYMQELGISLITLVDIASRQATAKGFALCIATLLFIKNVDKYSHGFYEHNIFYHLAQRKDLCDILNSYPGVLKQLLEYNNMTSPLLQDNFMLDREIAMLALCIDLESSPLAIALEYKNVAFVLLLLREISAHFVMEIELQQHLRQAIYLMITWHLDLAPIALYLRELTMRYESDILPSSYLTFMQELLHDITLRTSDLSKSTINRPVIFLRESLGLVATALPQKLQITRLNSHPCV